MVPLVAADFREVLRRPRLVGSRLVLQYGRTLAIEVGMQSSGLGAALATQCFGAAAALPAAVFSVWHDLSGSALAARWSRRPAPGGYSKPPSS